MLLACFPFSKPETIKGAWYYGFETNVFLEGKHASPDRGFNSEGDTNLQYDPHLPNDGQLRVLQIQLVGRRSQCPMGFPKHIIVVDRVISSSVKAVSE
jgi:hypothetical protein